MDFGDETNAEDGPRPVTGVRFSGTGSGLSPSSDVPVKGPKKAKTPEIDVPRLARAMQRARLVLRYFREERREAVRQIVGKHWSEQGSDKKVPVNLLAMYLQVVGRNLIAKNPRVMVTTRDVQNRPAVAAMQEWANRRIEEMYFAEELRKFVTDALLSVGIMKVGIAAPADALRTGYTNPVGVPFAETIDLDDFVFDVSARSFREATYMGHRFRVPESQALELGYEKKGAAELKSDGTRAYNAEGDERIGQLGRDYEISDDDEFDPMVELWEIYLPRTKQIVILACDYGGVPLSDADPLKVSEWFGPACGPYHFLSFMSVPGNAMPKAPVQDLVDLADLVNRLYRKLGNQAERQKSVLPVRGGATDDAGQLRQTPDGDMFGCDNPEGMKEVSFGGPSPVNLQFAIHAKDLFSFVGGNLDLLGGRSPQSKTASQDKMLNENASAGVSDMQDTTVSVTAKVLDALMWFWWHHPELVMKTSRTAGPGLEDVAITRQLHPRGAVAPDGRQEPLQRVGRYEDMNLRVDPYSMRYRSPQERLQFLNALVQQFTPLMPLLQQQGVVLDAQFLMKKISEYADEPDVVQLFTVQEPPATPEGGQTSPEMPGAGGPNGGEYIRRSVGNDTQANREGDIANAASQEGAQQ